MVYSIVSFSFVLINKGQYNKYYSREQFFVSIVVSCHREFLSIGFKTFILRVPMTRNFCILFERAFKMTKNGVYFIVIALLVAELFKILIYANYMICDVKITR